MKYCQHCGAPLNDNAEICTKCGCRVKNSIEENLKGSFALGFLASFFFGIIGLIIGLVCGGKTKDGAVKGFVVSIILSIIFVVLYFVVIAGMLDYGELLATTNNIIAL